MSFARKLRRSEKLRARALVKLPPVETLAERDLRNAFYRSAIPTQLKNGSINTTPIAPKKYWWFLRLIFSLLRLGKRNEVKRG